MPSPDVSLSSWQSLPFWMRTAAAQTSHSVLLETAKPSGLDDRSLLFLKPHRELIAFSHEDLDNLLKAMDRALRDGWFAAGYFNYECGERFLRLPAGALGLHSTPLAWLGIFAEPIVFHHATGELSGPLPQPLPAVPDLEAEAELTSFGVEIEPAEYHQAIKRIQEYLRDGHTYQVNFTDRICGRIRSSPLGVYSTLLRRQPVPFAAYVNRPEGPLLSFSPEMFFRISGNRISVRPMKGTWPRGVDAEDDRQAMEHFRNDLKNRSELITIVDLLRNDLGSVCALGSVGVDSLFSVEPYKTLLQMTSTISGELRKNIAPSETFRNLFPSGSITGAPKRRTMEIIRELERHPRGAYTGAIGYFSPTGDACFNVAIRTMELQGDAFTMGVGGGITADSRAEDEYEECRLKGRFLTHPQPPFSLIETMRCENGAVPLLTRHMDRLARSAAYLGIAYDASALEEALREEASMCGQGVWRLRLEVNEAGEPTITSNPLEETPWSGRLCIAEQRVSSRDVFLHHKTTQRAFYEQAFAAAHKNGFDEVLFLNEKAELTECAISSIFVQKNGRWYTPPLHCGVLPGIQRAVLLEELPDAEEAILTLDDLVQAEAVFVCNALRGARPVQRIENSLRTVIWQNT